MSAENLTLLTFDEDAPITVGTLTNTKMLEGTTVTDFGAQALKYVTGRTGLNLLLDFGGGQPGKNYEQRVVAGLEWFRGKALRQLIRDGQADPRRAKPVGECLEVL